MRLHPIELNRSNSCSVAEGLSFGSNHLMKQLGFFSKTITIISQVLCIHIDIEVMFNKKLILINDIYITISVYI